MGETQTVTELSKVIYNFLPGKAHPYSRVKTDFRTVSMEVGLGHFWPGGSKLPAIQSLLDSTLRTDKLKFRPLLLHIVREGLKYRSLKGNPITQEEIERINILIANLGMFIPELADSRFIASLPKIESASTEDQKVTPARDEIRKESLISIKNNFLQISDLDPQKRGYEFEKFLFDLFDLYGFNPRPSFRITGEQIDGSIEFEHQYYLIEAKWKTNPINEADILVLDGRVSGRSPIARGIFITMGNFSREGIDAYQRLGPSAIFGVDGQDIYFILEKGLPLNEVFHRKIRWLVETGDFHYPVAKFYEELI